ncbi:MAG: hypothetical protein J6Z43_01935 [Clostridiales bacterium]|nr:hypothetical protein [Clostridiales bacterium]
MTLNNRDLTLEEMQNIAGGEGEDWNLINPVSPDMPTFERRNQPHTTDDGIAFLNVQDDPNGIKALYHGLVTCADAIGSFFKGLGDP